MTIPELIKAYQKRLAYLQSLRTSAEYLGDVKQVEQVDLEIAETQETLNKLLLVA